MNYTKIFVWEMQCHDKFLQENTGSGIEYYQISSGLAGNGITIKRIHMVELKFMAFARDNLSAFGSKVLVDCTITCMTCCSVC